MELRRHYIIAYDISETKLRTKIKKTCEGYGFRIQFSVFLCYLSDKQLNRLIRDLKIQMKRFENLTSTKSILIFQQCQTCDKSRIEIGDQLERRSKTFQII